MGPIALFDKSFLQSLNTDEAVWFDNFFYPVTCPLFYIETLADIWKKPRAGKTAEDEVGIIASKTPQLHGGPCYFHRELCIQDFLGNHVSMNGQIPIAGTRRVFRDGKEGDIVEVTEEAKAFDRWQHGNFFDVERLHARKWREHVESINLAVIEKFMKKLGVSAKTCRSKEAAFKFANEALTGMTKTSARFDVILEVLEISHKFRLQIKERWKRKGKQPLRIFAPYAAHILHVELFFRIALGANLISSTRPSHKVDIAYLYYLPFCSIFISSDKLHRQCVPLFLRDDQQFVWGPELKADLTTLNAHYSALPAEIRSQSIYKFARSLPDESQGLIRRLFEQHTPHLLKQSALFDPEKIDRASHKNLVEHVKKWEDSPSEGTSVGGALETLIIKRSINRMRGSWVQLGPEASDA